MYSFWIRWIKAQLPYLLLNSNKTWRESVDSYLRTLKNKYQQVK